MSGAGPLHTMLTTVQLAGTSGDECDLFANSCVDDGNYCLVDNTCLSQAVSDLDTSFVMLRIFEGNTCDGSPKRFVYHRLDTCIDQSIVETNIQDDNSDTMKFTCTAGVTTVEYFSGSDCATSSGSLQLPECQDGISTSCPVDPPTPKPSPRARNVLVVIVVIVGVTIVLMAIAAFYFRE